MPEFQFTARDSTGIARNGAMTAPSRRSVASRLRERGWIVLSVDQAGAADAPAARETLVSQLPTRSFHVEVTLQQLAMMLRSGMTLLESISAVAAQSPRRRLAGMWQEVNQDIQRGSGFAEALARHRGIPSFVVRLVEVGERTGNLAVVLARAADTMKHRRMTRESFVSATIYPVLVVLLSIFVTGYMVIYLIPRLETYLTSLGRDMPAMTQSLIDGSLWLRSSYHLLLAGLLVAAAAVCALYTSRESRQTIDRLLLRLPVLGYLMRLGETSTFARGLGMMLKSGITVTDAILAVENTLGNFHLRRAVRIAREKLIRGHNLVDALGQKQSFTPLLQQMLAVGEKSGDLAGVLDEVAAMSDQQYAAAVKRLHAVVTPALTLGIGGIVGYVYIAFFMALVAAGS
jgi:type IV pilus assembly protein PilC